MIDQTQFETLQAIMLAQVPEDGSSIGNQSLLRAFTEACSTAGIQTDEDVFQDVRESLLDQGLITKGRGRGGSVLRVLDTDEDTDLDDDADMEGDDNDFTLESQDAPPPSPQQMRLTPRVPAPKKTTSSGEEAQIIAYRHNDKRKNNPEVGMVNPASDPEQPKTAWAYDPHIDPTLQFDSCRAQIEQLIDDALASGDAERMKQALEELKRLQSPYLNWTGKTERTSFEVDTVSLHVHERIDPASILATVRKRMKGKKDARPTIGFQTDLFAAPFENLPLREAIDFYKHERGWSNRLIAGDSLLVMNSLLQKESMGGQVQMIYIDPPYGIKYGSNFQPFVNKRDVKDRSDADLTQEPEMIKAFRDTWELGIHSYLTYLRDRLLLARELLHESGSVFVQISDENLHHVTEILDELFGATNRVAVITFRKTSGAGSISGKTNTLAGVSDYLVWYAKSIETIKYRQLYLEKSFGGEGASQYQWLEERDGQRRRMTSSERSGPSTWPEGAKPFGADNLTSASGVDTTRYPVNSHGREFTPHPGVWKTGREGMPRILKSNRAIPSGSGIYYVRYLDDFAARPINDLWDDTISSFMADKYYVVQTNVKVIERCILMTTAPGDLVLDPTCGSGTTAYVAEKWGRRWITCDTSRVAVTLAKQRLMTASYDYFDLKYPHEGLRGGFIYKTLPHVTLKSIANNPEIDEIYAEKHPAIQHCLDELNKALNKEPPKGTFVVSEGARKGRKLDFAKGDVLQEWEVPFDYPEHWSKAALDALAGFHSCRQAMQTRMDQSIAAHADQETLYDRPQIAKNKLRITGPFTVEAVPFPTVLSLEDSSGTQEADVSIARSGESSRQHQWRDELLKTGIRGKGGQMLKFAELETLAGTRHLHVSGTLADSGDRVVVSFGPEHAALEQRQVAQALSEAEKLRPAPRFIVFAAFTFDPEAAKDIDETVWPGVTLLKAQMNTDLLTEDLKRGRANSQSFWLMGQPEVEVRPLHDGKYEVEVHGFDYFDTVKGELVSGGKSKIAMWMLDTDYDERSLYPHQVFFPMAGAKEGWNKLKRNIRAELNEDLLDQFLGTVSLPFEAGDNRKVAVKIVDDRGIESIKIIALE